MSVPRSIIFTLFCAVVSLLTGEGVFGQATGPAAAHSEAERRALAGTKDVLLSIAQKENIVQTTAESLALKREWLKHREQWERVFAQTDRARDEASAEYLKSLHDLGKRVFTRIMGDTVPVREARAYIAEANTREAMLPANAETLPAASRPAARAEGVMAAQKKELQAVEDVLKNLDEKTKLISLTPEFVDMRARWAYRALWLRLQLASEQKVRVKIGENFVASQKDFRDEIRKREQIDADRIAIGIAEVGVAEAEVVLEKIKARQEIREW